MLNKNLKKIRINPALQIIIGFLIVILIGTFLLCLPISSNEGIWFGFIDSLFTSTSALCVTGLIVADTAVQFTLFGQIVILLLIQIGGLGFITITSLLFLLIGKKIGYEKRIVIQESLNQDNNQGVVKLVKNIIIFVFSIEFIGFLLLSPSFIVKYGWLDGMFKALFTAISAFCNAGFDIVGTSGTAFQSLMPFAENVFVLVPIILLIITGGIGFIVIFDLKHIFKRDKKLTTHSKIMLIGTSILIFGGAIIYGLLEWNNPLTIGNMSLGGKILNCFFQSVTTRTAGFSTINQTGLSSTGRILTDILMFIGAGPTSAAGGVKISTIFLIFILMFNTPNSKGDFTYHKKRISNKLIRKATRILLLVLAVLIVSTISLSIIEGESITVSAIIYELISAVSTVGLSMGITPTLHILSKIIIAVVMFTGRIGVLTISIAFVTKNNDIQDEIEYPDAKIIVG